MQIEAASPEEHPPRGMRRGFQSGLRSGLTHPMFWLCAQILVLLAWLYISGRFEFVWHPDSDSYVGGAQATSMTAWLSHYRTTGYPGLLRWLGWWRAQMPRVVVFQTLFYVLAVPVFWYSLSTYIRSRWAAFVAASVLFFHPILELSRFILPDSLSAACGILAVSSVMLLAVRPARSAARVSPRPPGPIVWIGLVVAGSAAYQLRPAMLFMIVFIPLAGGLFHWARWRRPAGGFRFATGLGLALIAPLLLFTAVRWAYVGHFGLVAFGASNLSGATVNFLDTELVESMPPLQQAVARRIFNARVKRGFEPYDPEGDPRVWFEQFSDNLWHINITVTEHILKTRERAERSRVERRGEEYIPSNPRSRRIQRDVMLMDLSKEILLRRPGYYVKWVVDSNLYGWRQLPGQPWVRWPLILAMLAVPVGFARRRLRRWSGEHVPVGGGRNLELWCVVLVGIGYFAAYTGLISLVSFPFHRYFLGTLLFVPSSLSLAAFELWRWALHPSKLSRAEN